MKDRDSLAVDGGVADAQALGLDKLRAERLADILAERGLAEAREEHSVLDVREWIAERLKSERRDTPTDQSTPAYAMTLGAVEVLDALIDFLDGDDEA